MTDRMSRELELELGEIFRVGEVWIVVGEIHGTELRLSIDAPRHVIILRGELLDRRRRGRRGSS